MVPFKKCLKDSHLGYNKYERVSDVNNYRKGTKSKRVRSKYGELDINIPQDRQSSFEPQIVPKRQKNISQIDDKIISMYAKGMSTRQTTFEATRKWTMPLRNWGKVYGELSIMFQGRLG